MVRTLFHRYAAALSAGCVVAFALIGFSACSMSSPITAEGAPSAKTIGYPGGAVVSSDGRVTVTVPVGALDEERIITITPIVSPVAGALGQAYEIGPATLSFAVPVTLAFTYADASIDGNWPADLLIGTVIANAWAPSSDATLDEDTDTVIANTTHFGPFALIVHKHDWDASADAHADD